MWPQDDDEFEGDATSIIPISATVLPAPVLARARQILSQMILAGDGAIHRSFTLTYGDRSWVAMPRQDPFGGYRLIFSEEGGCEDRDALLVIEDSNDSKFYALYNNGDAEWINPEDGTPRPDPETADRSIGYKVSESLRLDDWYSLVTPSMFTGQMRQLVQCRFHGGKTLGGGRLKDASMANVFSYGVVEHPATRVVGADAAEEILRAKQRRKWLVEISDEGVYATALGVGSHKCCDWGGVPSGWGSQTAPKSLYTLYTESNPRVTRILTASDMAAVFANSQERVAYFTNWAFSYSGHEAQLITRRAGTFTDSHAIVFDTTKFNRWKLEFTVSGSPPALSAVLTAVETDKEIFGFPGAPLVPRVSEVPFPGTSTGSQLSYMRMLTRWSEAGVNDTLTHRAMLEYGDMDVPVHVCYAGDTERVTRCKVEDAFYTETTFPPPDDVFGPLPYQFGATYVVDVAGTTYSGTSSWEMDGFESASAVDQDYVALNVVIPWLDAEAVAVLEDAAVYNGGGRTTTTYRKARLHVLDEAVVTLDPSTNIHANITTTVQVGLFVMRGAQWYTDYTLTPSAQKTNKAYILTNTLETTGTATQVTQAYFDNHMIAVGGFDSNRGIVKGFTGRI